MKAEILIFPRFRPIMKWVIFPIKLEQKQKRKQAQKQIIKKKKQNRYKDKKIKQDEEEAKATIKWTCCSIFFQEGQSHQVLIGQTGQVSQC